MTKSIQKISLILIVLLVAIAVLGFMPSMAFAQGQEQYINLYYLKRIPNTPFAEKVFASIKVPVYDNHKIEIADVKKALHCKTFGVMQSYCNRFEYVASTNTYTAVYNKSVWLNAMTVDGKSEPFYLDCNMTFGDYFRPFVKSGIISAGAYEIVYNNIKVRYPALDEGNYDFDNLYGYFAFVPIPKTYSLNQLFADIFVSTTYEGILDHYMFPYSFSSEAYDKLLSDYQYGWLARVWNGFMNDLNSGTDNAHCYMLYVDSDTTEAFIGENGAESFDDNRGAIVIGIDKFLSDPKNIWAIVGIIFGGLILVAMIMIIVLVVKSIAKTATKEAAKNGKQKR